MDYDKPLLSDSDEGKDTLGLGYGIGIPSNYGEVDFKSMGLNLCSTFFFIMIFASFIALLVFTTNSDDFFLTVLYVIVFCFTLPLTCSFRYFTYRKFERLREDESKGLYESGILNIRCGFISVIALTICIPIICLLIIITDIVISTEITAVRVIVDVVFLLLLIGLIISGVSAMMASNLRHPPSKEGGRFYF